MQEFVTEVARSDTDEEVGHCLPASGERPGERAVAEGNGQTQKQARKEMVQRLRLRMMREMQGINELATFFASRLKVKYQAMQAILDQSPTRRPS